MSSRMHFTVVLVLLLLAAVALGAGSGVSDLAAEGDRLYKDGEYAGAVDAYKRVLESGWVSGQVLFNMGNAYYKLGQIGPAILNYERAQKLMPQNSDIRYNLKMAQARTVDRIEAPPRLPIWNLLDSLRDLFSPALVAWTTWILAVITALLFGLSLIVKHLLARSALRIIMWVFLGVFIISGSLLGLRIAEANGPAKAVIMTEKVIVRSAPDPAAKEVFHLHEGTTVTIVKVLDTYREVRLIDGRQGWLPVNVLEKV